MNTETAHCPDRMRIHEPYTAIKSTAAFTAPIAIEFRKTDYPTVWAKLER